MKNLFIKTKRVLAIMCAVLMIFTLSGCLIDLDRTVYLEGTWNSYKAVIENDGIASTVEITSENENRSLFRQFVFKEENKCSVGYYGFVGQDYQNNNDLYSWTKKGGTYSYDGRSVIGTCDNTVYRFSYDESDGTLILLTDSDGIPMRTYLEKISACYY